MNIKDNRQAAITSIINSRRIHTQEELADALGEKGHSVTQATPPRERLLLQDAAPCRII